MECSDIVWLVFAAFIPGALAILWCLVKPNDGDDWTGL